MTESRFEITKKIPVKIALVTPSGEPFVNSSPVSLVRYSHGGQYIAIVTGRLVQIYHLYNLDYSTDKAGAPTRVMALSEHNAAVTDLAFSVDDRKIYTTSQDGALYEWTFGKATRDSDFIVKNVPALNVASSPLMSTVIAYFESPEVSTEKSKRNTLTKRGSVSSGIMQPPFQSSQSFSANVNKNRASMTTLGALDSTIVASAESLGTTTQRKMFLAYFESGVVSTTDGKILPVDVPVTSIAFGIADHSRQDTSKPGEIFVMGLADGRVLITMLPLPLRVLDDIGALQIIVRTTTTMSAGSGDNAILGSPIASRLPSSAGMDVDDLALTELTAELADQEVPMHGLDDSKCRAIALHEGAVMNVVVSPSGNWILSAGIDGCLFLLATTVRARTMENALESLGGDNTVFLTDRMALLSNKETLENMRQFVADAELEKNRSIGEMQTNMNNHSKELTAHLQSELERRDGIIVKGREEQTRICRIMQEEIDSNKAVHEKAIQELEVYYEKRLAQVLNL